MKNKCEKCKHYTTCKKRIVINVKYRRETVEYINPKKCKDYIDE